MWGGENIYVVTKPFVDYDSYGPQVPQGQLVQWHGGPNNPVNFYPGLSKVVTYYPKKIQPFLRQATPEELQKLVRSFEITERLGDVFPIRGQGPVGADPELFVTGRDGKVIPAFKFLPAKKNGSFTQEVYWDGFQAEFTTSASGCLASTVDSFHNRIKELQRLAKLHDPHSKLIGDCVVPVDPKDLQESKTIHTQLGCAPSKNAYGVCGRPVPDGRELPIRFAGCHCHLGRSYSQRGDLSEAEANQYVKCIDAIAGVLSVSVLEGLENPIRRVYYGLAGEYRLPEHGLEYRVFSSALLWHPMLVHLHFNFARMAQELAKAGLQWLWKAEESEVQHAINSLDVDLAREILLRNQRFMEKALWGLYHDPTQPALNGCKPEGVPPPKRIFEEFILKGVKGFIELDIEKNWLLSRGWMDHSEGPEVMVWRAMKKWLK